MLHHAAISEILTDVKLVQPENALVCMDVTVAGIVTVVKLVHPEKADDLMYRAPSIVTDCKPVQPENAELSILVTLDGMVMDVKPVRPLKAYVPIFVTVEGMLVFLAPTISSFDVVCIIQFFPPPSLYTVFPDATLIFAKFVHPSNTL